MIKIITFRVNGYCKNFISPKLKFFESVFIIVRGLCFRPSFLINHSSLSLSLFSFLLRREVKEDSEEGRKVKEREGGDENWTTWMLARSI